MLVQAWLERTLEIETTDELKVVSCWIRPPGSANSVADPKGSLEEGKVPSWDRHRSISRDGGRISPKSLNRQGHKS